MIKKVDSGSYSREQLYTKLKNDRFDFALDIYEIYVHEVKKLKLNSLGFVVNPIQKELNGMAQISKKSEFKNEIIEIMDLELTEFYKTHPHLDPPEEQ